MQSTTPKWFSKRCLRFWDYAYDTYELERIPGSGTVTVTFTKSYKKQLFDFFSMLWISLFLIICSYILYWNLFAAYYLLWLTSIWATMILVKLWSRPMEYVVDSYSKSILIRNRTWKGKLVRKDNIEALQLLASRHYWERAGVYYTYECNLAMKNKRRINLFAIASHDAVYTKCMLISELLEIPVWNDLPQDALHNVETMK